MWQIVAVGKPCKRKGVKAGYDYKKAGVMLTDITSGGCRQAELFGPVDTGREPLMATLDKINRNWADCLR